MFSLVNINAKKDSLWAYHSVRGIPYYDGKRVIKKMRTLENGNIFGWGSTLWQYKDINFDSLSRIYAKTYELAMKALPTQSPYIISLDPKGNKLYDRAVIMMDSLDQVSPGIFHDFTEMNDGSLVLSGTIGTFTKTEPSQNTPHNWNGLIIKLNPDGCYADYPCTKTKTFLQPSRVLPFFDPKNKWLLVESVSKKKKYVKFSPDKKIMNGYSHFVLLSSDDSSFINVSEEALFYEKNEAIYQLDTNGKYRSVFAYDIFPGDKWRDTIRLDTSYFIMKNGERTKQFSFKTFENDRLDWYNLFGCPQDFYFDSYLSPNKPIWNICKFWKADKLVYSDTMSNCLVNEVVEKDKYDIRIFPNPVKDRIIIDSNLKDLSYQIINIDGSIFIEGKVNPDNQILIHELSKGMYILKISNTHQQVIKVEKILKI